MSLAFLVPGSLDQLTGGYLYDRHVVDGLRRHGWAVDVVELPGRYPDADAEASALACEALLRLPDGSIAVLDGLALPGFAECLRTQGTRLRLVGLIHHPLSLETGAGSERARHFARLEAGLWPCLAAAVCPSEHTAAAVRAAGLPADRVSVIAPGTARPVASAASARRSANGPLRLLSVGSVVPRKGHRLLVEALAGIGSVDWRLDCIGSLERDPAAVDDLRACIAAHGLGERIALRGEQPAGPLAEAYREADLFVLPSYHEGYGMVFAEALAHGLPVVATTAGAIPDTVPAAASRLVPPGDMPALQAALRLVLTDPGLRARLAAGAVQAAAALPSWSDAVRAWMTVLDGVAQR
jgi:glycosyltransferase involved in cell wall biosynthesis